MMSTRLTLLLIFGQMLIGPARAESVPGEATPPGASAATEPGTAQVPPVDGADDSEAPRAPSRRRRPKPSRLTHDSSERAADRRRMLLTTGEDRAVDLDFELNGGSNAIIVGNQQVVVVQPVKVNGQYHQVIFKPLKAGETTATIRDTDGSIRLIFTVVVTGNNLLRRAGEIRDLLRDIEGVEIRIIGQKIVVDGEVLVPADYARVIQVVNSMDKGLVLNLTQLSPLAIRVLADRIKADINVFAPKVEVRVVNGLIFLEGSVDSIDKAKRSFELAKLYLPEAKPANPLTAADPNAATINRQMVHNFIVVDAPPPKKNEKLVRVTVHYVELSKNYNRYFGFKWQPGFTTQPTIAIGQAADGATGATGPTFSATISSLFPKLNSGQDAGFARILKTSTVIVRSGQAANLEETTDFPYTTTGPNGQAIGASKSVGLTMSVTPKILGQSDDIEMELDLSQSSVVSPGVNGGAPISAAHKVKTKIYVKSNESAAVAGVNSADVNTGFNKDDPNAGSFGGDTSPLFTLKHTKSFAKKKGQFVIFVTPQVIENASEGTEDLKRNFRVKVK